ncbi:hypothetical protein [Hydrocoleum sp. CS-953]|nr:hypothetical protein [Hydrocoleum sp. CS-953]
MPNHNLDIAKFGKSQKNAAINQIITTKSSEGFGDQTPTEKNL